MLTLPFINARLWPMLKPFMLCLQIGDDGDPCCGELSGSCRHRIVAAAALNVLAPFLRIAEGLKSGISSNSDGGKQGYCGGSMRCLFPFHDTREPRQMSAVPGGLPHNIGVHVRYSSGAAAPGVPLGFANNSAR